mmetsp:Transcript_25202/g.36879  ORF Transcript_25202/g.36879 Transcript_25202/m.36879 type:complete len:192 (+) Transcript_25202:1092-1667(+)
MIGGADDDDVKHDTCQRGVAGYLAFVSDLVSYPVVMVMMMNMLVVGLTRDPVFVLMMIVLLKKFLPSALSVQHSALVVLMMLLVPTLSDPFPPPRLLTLYSLYDISPSHKEGADSALLSSNNPCFSLSLTKIRSDRLTKVEETLLSTFFQVKYRSELFFRLVHFLLLFPDTTTQLLLSRKTKHKQKQIVWF